jgi:hypothetical protein
LIDWIDRDSLFDGVSIGKCPLRVKVKAITRYGLAELSQADGVGLQGSKSRVAKNRRERSSVN